MLAARRGFGREGALAIATPLLVPSFSSKGFPDLQAILAATERVIDSAILVSAYDYHHRHLSGDVDFAEAIILDSGGYESGTDLDLSEVAGAPHVPLSWTRTQHAETVTGWNSSRPTIIVSYDHHLDRVSLATQIERARADIPSGGLLFSELLLKPEAVGSAYLDIARIVAVATELVTFDAVGVTEKEIGDTVLARMVNIAKLRMALNKAGGEGTPIHVFGSLDTISTPLYQIAGADVFDGLTWLRYAFDEGLTIYRQNYAAQKLGLDLSPDLLSVTTWFNNYRYLQDLQLQMCAFAESGDFSAFRHNASLFAGAWEQLSSTRET